MLIMKIEYNYYKKRNILYSLKFDYKYLFQPTQLVLQAQNNQEAFHVKIDIATEEISRWMELVDVSIVISRIVL